MHATRSRARRALERLGVEANDYLITASRTPKPAKCTAKQGYRPFMDRPPRPGMEKQTKANRDSFVGQLTNKKMCYDLISRREARQRWSYDYVLYARPDLTWWRPIDPWCLWLNSHLPEGAATKGPAEPQDGNPPAGHRLPTGFKYADFALVVPGSQARRFLEQPYIQYHACEAPFGPGMMIETWMEEYGHMEELQDAMGTFLPLALTRSAEASMQLLRPMTVRVPFHRYSPPKETHITKHCKSEWPIAASVVNRSRMCAALFGTNPTNKDWEDMGSTVAAINGTRPPRLLLQS